VGCGLQFFQQFVGINTVMYYGPQIILGTGLKIGDLDTENPETGVILNMPLAFMNALGSAIATFYIDRMGRRYIMLRMLPGIFCSLILVAVAFYLSLFTVGTAQSVGNYLSLLGLISYLGFFSIGMSAPVWSVNTEIYPIHLVG